MYTGVTRGSQVTGIAVMALSLTWISALLRLHVRTRILKFMGQEDWLMFATMILLTLLCSLFLSAKQYGLGAHMKNIPPTDKETGFKVIFICELLYVVTTAVAKLSIGVYFLRLCSKKYQTRVVYLTLAVVMVFTTTYFFFLLFQCTPINFLWTQFVNSQGSCLHSPILANVTYAHAAMSAITDWSFGILPIAFVWKMQMNPRTKFSVILILSLGFFASSATIVRIVYIRSLTQTRDYSWEAINLVKWSMVEPGIAITAANIATLRPLFNGSIFFARKNADKDEDDESVLGQRKLPNRHDRDTVSAKHYSPEFADMLGLSQARSSVTTEISAGTPNKTSAWFSLSRVLSRGRQKGDEMELEGWTDHRGGVEDWPPGIHKTTVITINK
ncbi:hypothetical protein LOCC1_G003504 [Lachnellula occidentalis]|uniref:Rhodopsin domain-containing protein n=1 Tax=Lachnellula occidentalis TaxID=215460 RepID=A0A8H8RWE8_9HELO|nr:hypothetical protein LOCC1_G003504 [Lachnellula occidentalis]